MLSVFIAFKHSTINVSYLKQQQLFFKKSERITPLFQSYFSILELVSVWTLYVISLLAVRSISIWVFPRSVVSFFLSIFSLSRSLFSLAFDLSICYFSRYFFSSFLRSALYSSVSHSPQFCMYVRLSVQFSMLSRCLSLLNCDTLNSNWLIVVIIYVNGYA